MLTSKQSEHWQNTGWIHIPQAIAPLTLEATRYEVNQLADRPSHIDGFIHYFEETGYGRKLCRTERFLEHSDPLERLICMGKIPDIASSLLNEQALLFKEKINYKPAGGAGFVAHQDATAYDFVSHHITCLLALDDMTVENGCLEFAAWQQNGLLETDDKGCIRADIAENQKWHAVEAEAGDLVYFDSYTPHRSGPNQTTADRRALYLTYNAESDSDMRQRYYDQRHSIVSTMPGQRISTIGHFSGKNITTGDFNDQ